MKTLPVGLQDHLDSGATTLCWCWRLERRDGAVFGFTDHDVALTFGSVTYEAQSGLSASEVRASADLSVDGQDAEGALVSGRITETDIYDGLWDNAAVELWRVNWQDVAQRVLMRRGNLGEITRGRVAFTAETRSLSHYLNQTIGRTFQYYCDAELGDGRCQKDVSGVFWTGAGTVTAAAGAHMVASGLGAYASGWFNLGRLTWATGANAGRETEVIYHLVSGSEVRLQLTEEPVRAIEVGDTFSVTAGCDKTSPTCRLKFGNFINFRGFPTIPGDESVIRYPNHGDTNGGVVLGNRT